MILPFYLFKRFLNSIFICGGTSYSIFFIFSLIGNLGEKFSFTSILYLSALNSLQIFTYIPSHLFILSFCLFIVNLKSKNELIIIKEYIKLTNLFLIIFPILFLFILIEYNKDTASSSIEKIKSNLISSKNLKDTKIYIDTEGVKKIYTILSKSQSDGKFPEQYLSYQINNHIIEKGELSNNLDVYETDLLSHETTVYENNDFKYEYSKKKVFINFTSFWSEDSKIVSRNKGNNLKSNFNIIQSILFYSLFYLCMSMIFLSKILVNRGVNIAKIFLLVILIFLYYLLTPKIMLNNFHYYFQIISLIIFLLIFFRIKKHE